jgi:predicted alpha-1,2-mannosidase
MNLQAALSLVSTMNRIAGRRGGLHSEAISSISRYMWRGCLASILVGIFGTSVLYASTAQKEEPADTPYKNVDPFIGTANGGNTYPGAALPFGMIQWSPDTGNAYYTYHDHAIHGFSLTHLSGVGCSVFADMPVLPLSQRPEADRSKTNPETASFDHAHEIATPGYYSVELENGIRVELAVSDRSGIARITFPKGAHAGLLINGAGGASTYVHMSFLPPAGREKDGEQLEVNDDGAITGTITTGGFCGSPSKYTLHVAFETKKRPVSYSLWQDNELQEHAKLVKGRRTVGWVDLGDDSEQLVKVGLSYVSEENAIANLRAEIPNWNFDEVRKRAEARWVDALSKIEIKDTVSPQKRIFYTGLYHMLLSETLFSDVDGSYMGFDERVHKVQGTQRHQYTNISDWDVYRNTVQLQALLFPREASDLAQSLVNDAQQLGSYPRWPVANDATYVMGGDSPPIIVSSIYAFGARDFDVRESLRMAIKTATQPALGEHGRFERDNLADYITLGYIPSSNSISASETLEFANTDFAIAQLAGAVGDTTVQQQMMKRSGNWRNLLDPETRWIRPRAADGTWIDGFDAEKSLPHRPKASVPTDQYGFEEGNTYQYTFMLPFDYAGLFHLIGDDQIVEQRLDRFFRKLVCWSEPCFNMANEPDFVTPYAYTFLGKPWKTADVLRRIESETFDVTPSGIPGNDDLGATSGVYVWNAMGMYPAIPGLGGVVFGTPLFKEVTLHLGNGGTVSILRNGDGGPYVESVVVNDKQQDSSWLPVQTFLGRRTRVVFSTTSKQGAKWGTGKANLPPSSSEVGLSK